MTISFKNKNDVVVYSLERIISYARQHQYLSMAQSVWWLASTIGVEQGLITHINNHRNWEIVAVREVSNPLQERQTTSESADLPSQVYPDRFT